MDLPLLEQTVRSGALVGLVDLEVLLKQLQQTQVVLLETVLVQEFLFQILMQLEI